MAQARPARERETGKAAQARGAQGAGRGILLWEWAVAAVGLVLVVGAIGYLGYTGLTERAAPPSVSIEVLSVAPDGKGWLVRFVAVNHGASTAAQLTVGGALKEGETTVEESEATIDYLPSNSERQGGLFFSRNPADYRLELRPLGYAEP